MIKEINSSLPPTKNTLISFEHISSKPDQWQAFLETMIPDFLTECGVWWKENETGIEFFDVKNNAESKLVKHHYRSSSIVSEEKYLKNMWKLCVNNKNTLIPAKRLETKKPMEILLQLQIFPQLNISAMCFQ